MSTPVVGGTAGKVRAALALLQEGDSAAKGDACSDLRQLASNSAGKVALMQAGAGEPLTQFLLQAGKEAKEAGHGFYLGAGLGAAGSCIAGLASLHSGRSLCGVALEAVPSLCQVLELGAPEGQAQAASALIALLPLNPNASAACLEHHAPMHLGQMVRTGHQLAGEMAVSLLGLLAERQEGQVVIAKDEEVVSSVLELLESSSPVAQAQAAGLLHRLAGVDVAKAHLLRQGAPDRIQRVFQYAASQDVKQACQLALNALWTSTSSAPAEPEPPTEVQVAGTSDPTTAPETPALPATEDVTSSLPPIPPASAAVAAAAHLDSNAAPPLDGPSEDNTPYSIFPPPTAAALDPASDPYNVPNTSAFPSDATYGASNGLSDIWGSADTTVPTLSSTSGLGALSSSSGLGNIGYKKGSHDRDLGGLDDSMRGLGLGTTAFPMQGGAVEEASWRADAISKVPEVGQHVPRHPGAGPGGLTEEPSHGFIQPAPRKEDDFAFNHQQLSDFARVSELPEVEDYSWNGEKGAVAGAGALQDLNDVIPLIEMLTTGDDAQKDLALNALNALAVDHQQALMEAGVVPPLVRVLERAGKIAGVAGLEAEGTGVAHAASIMNSLWRWGRPQERVYLEKSALEVLDGLVQLLYNGTVRGKEQAASALGTLGAMSDAIKLAFAEAGAVKPLVKLLRVGSAQGREEAEGVLWTLLALNRDNSQGVKLSVEAAADMTLLLGTTPQLAKEAAGVLRGLIPNNRSILIQAGCVEGLMQVLHKAGAECTGEGVGISEAATAMEVLARGDTRISAICLEAVPGIIALLMRGTQTGREQAIGALWALSSVNDRVKVSMVEEGAVNLLVDQLGKGANRQMDETTAGVLYSLLAVNSRSRKFWSRYSDGRTDQEVSLTLAAAKGLVPLLHTGSELMREAAAGVVNLCATSDRNRVNIMRARAVEPLVELLHTGTEGAREQAGAALRALVDFVEGGEGADPTGDRQATGPRAVMDAVEQLVSVQSDYITADRSLAALLEQVVYDAFDRHVEEHVYIFESIEQEWDLQGTRLVPELRSLRERGLNNWRGGQPIVELLTFANAEVQTRAAAGLGTLSVLSKMELIEAGCLRPLVDLVGSVLASPLVALVLKSCADPEAEGLSVYMQALVFLGSKDTRVSRMAEDTVSPLVPPLETGSPKVREEAATAVRILLQLGEPLKVLVAKLGMFAPLVELLGTGTNKAKEMAAWSLEALTSLMADCNVEVNISRTAALDLIKMIEDGSESAQEAAVGVLFNVCNNDGNKAVLLHNRAVEPLVDILTKGNTSTRVRTAKLLRRLTVYADDAERFYQQEEMVNMQNNAFMQNDQQAAATGIVGGFLSVFSKTLTAPTPVQPVFTQPSMAGGPQQQAERLIHVLLSKDITQAGPTELNATDQLAVVLHRLLYDIFESSPAFGLNAPAPAALPQSELEYNKSLPIQAPVHDPSQGPIFSNSIDYEPGKAAGPLNLSEEVDSAILREMDPNVGSFNQGPPVTSQPIAIMEKPAGPRQDVRPLVQLLQAGTDETKLLALEAVQSLNLTTQVAIIEEGALRPLVELLGVGAGKALIAFMSKAASNVDGEFISDAARALCALASRDVGIAQAAIQCVDGLVALLLAGSDKGKEQAAAALWSLSITNTKLKMAVAHAGAIPPMVKLLGGGSAAGKEEAAGVLWTLLSHEDERKAAVDIKLTLTNALDLVHLLTTGTEMGKEAAAGVLRLTALLDLNKAPIIQSMAVEPLVELLYASHEGVRTQCAGVLRNLAVFQPNVYKDARPELSRAAGEVKRLVAMQLDPSTSSQYISAVLAQLVYDTFDLALKVRVPGTLGNSMGSSSVGDGAGADLDEAGAQQLITEREAQETLLDAEASEPMRRGAMQRMEYKKRIDVLVEMLKIAPVDQKQLLNPGMCCLNLSTKIALIEGGALYPYVELMGSDAGRPLAQLLVNAAKSGNATEVSKIAGALSSLAATDNSLSSLCGRCIPGLVNLLENGEDECKEEAANALKFFSIVSFNMKVQIAEAGAFGPLVKILGDGTPKAKEGAAGTLWRLVSMMNESNIEVNISTKKAADLVTLLHTGTAEGKEAAAGVLRLVAYNDANKLGIMRARAVEPLVELLESQSMEVREQAAGALNSIAADKDNRKRLVKAAEQVDRLVALMTQPATASTQLGALLEYLMYDIYDMRREYISEAGGDASQGTFEPPPSDPQIGTGAGGMLVEAHEKLVPGQEEVTKLKMRGRVLGGSKEANRGLLPLVQLLQTGTDKTKRMAAPAMAVLRTSTKVAMMEAGAVRPLVQMLGAASAKALVVLLSRMVQMADGAGIGGGTSVSELSAQIVECFVGLAEGDPRIGAMAAGVGGCIPSLIQLLETGNLAGQEQAATALRTLSVINKGLNVTIAREGAFEPLVKLLGTGTAAAREEAAGTLWRQLEMMRENAIEVNISVARVGNLVDLLKQGSVIGKENAAAVLRYCANSERNRANIMRGKATEVLVDLLQTSPPRVRIQVGLALRALARLDEQDGTTPLVPLGPHSNWIVRASAEAQNLVELLEEGTLQEGTTAEFAMPDPSESGIVPQESSKVLSVANTTKGLTVSAGSQQVAALLEQLLYDLFCLRLAPVLDPAEVLKDNGSQTEGNVEKAADMYLQCVSDGQATNVFRTLLQLFHQGAPETKRFVRDAVQWLSINTQVALIEAGALKPLVELLGKDSAPAVVQLLGEAGRVKEGTGIVDASRALRALAAEHAEVASMAMGSIKGLVNLLEVGVFGGREEAVRALWSLSVINDDLKYGIGQHGALQPLVEMLFTGKESFRDEVVGLLWSLAMHEGNVEPIIDVGAAAGLVRVLHTGSEVAQEAAAGVLRLCSAKDNNKSSIIWARAVEPLVDCLNLWAEGIRDQAAGALRNLSTWDTVDVAIQEACQEVEKLVEVRLVQSRLERMVQLPPNSMKVNLSALLERLILDIFNAMSTKRAAGGGQGAAQVLSSANAALIYGNDQGGSRDVSKLPDAMALETAKDSNPDTAGNTPTNRAERAMPFIVQLLQDGSDEVKGQAAGAVKCLALATHIAIIEAGGLKPLVDMIGCHCLEAILQLWKALDPGGEGGDITEYAIAVTRLAVGDPVVAVRADEIIRPTVQILELGTKRGKQEAATALRSLCGVGDQIKFAIAREGAFEPLVKLLGQGTIKAKEEGLGVLWQLVAMMADSNVDVNISPGPAADIAALLTSGIETTAVAAAGVLKLCAVAESNQAVILKTGAMPSLIEVTCSGLPSVREQSAGALINLAITDRGWCQDPWLVAAASEVEQLVHLFKHDTVTTTPGIQDPQGSQRQMMALLEQILVDLAECRALYYAAQRGTALPPQDYQPREPIGGDAADPSQEMMNGEGIPGDGAVVPVDGVEVEGRMALTEEQQQLNTVLASGKLAAGSQSVMDETEERINTRLQLLVKLLVQGEEPVVRVATSALRALTVDTKVSLIERGALKEVMELMGSSAAGAVVELIGKACHIPSGTGAGEYASALRNLASGDAEVAQMAMGTVQRLVHLLQRGNPKGKEEAASALWNLSTISEPVKTAMVEAGAVPYLIDCVNQGTPLARESAAGCLWSMSVVNLNIKEMVTRCGATGPLVELLISGSNTAKEEACGALWSLAMRPEATPEMVAHGAAQAAVELLYIGTAMGLESAAGLLGLCSQVDANKRALFQARCIEPLVALLSGSQEGARAQAASALVSLSTFRSAVPRAVERGATEVEDLIQKITPTTGKQLVVSLANQSDNILGQHPVKDGAGPCSEVNPLANLLEQLMYDLFDMATAAAVASAREVGDGVPEGADIPVGRDRSARPLVDMLLRDTYGVKQLAVGGLMCLSVNTKMAVIEGGALRELVELLGSGAAKAIVQLLAGAGRRPDGSTIMDLVESLRLLATQDTRVGAVAVGAVPGLVELLQTGSGAGKEVAAGALYYLRQMNPNIEGLIQQARVVEPLVEILGMGTAAGKETPAMLHSLWSLLTLPDGGFESISEAAAANLVQLLYTGSDVGKEGSARVIALCGQEEGNRAAVMRARAVEPLVELLQTGSQPVREQAAGALRSLANQSKEAAEQPVLPGTGSSAGGWFNMFGGGNAGGAVVPSGGNTGGAYGDSEAVRSAETEVLELIGMLLSVEIGYQATVMSQGGSIQRQRKAAARLEQLMYYLFHAKTSYIVM